MGYAHFGRLCLKDYFGENRPYKSPYFKGKKKKLNLPYLNHRFLSFIWAISSPPILNFILNYTQPFFL